LATSLTFCATLMNMMVFLCDALKMVSFWDF
jgi:hypothetical protein